MFHRRFNEPFGSFALHIIVLRATWFFDFEMMEVLSPNVMLSLFGVMRMCEICLRFWVTPMCLLAIGWLSDPVSDLLGVLYCMSICGSESDSWFHIAASLSVALFSFLLSKWNFWIYSVSAPSLVSISFL